MNKEQDMDRGKCKWVREKKEDWSAPLGLAFTRTSRDISTRGGALTVCSGSCTCSECVVAIQLWVEREKKKRKHDKAMILYDGNLVN